MLHPSDIRGYIKELRKCSEEEAENLLNFFATFFYNLGVEDEKFKPWPVEDKKVIHR